eukprot:COSAG01_NODE_5523_length_4206_cov_4.069150_3_plen_67_part_00
MMDSDFGNDEFFDGMDKQTARELGLSAGDESTDYFLASRAPVRRADPTRLVSGYFAKLDWAQRITC